MDLKEKTLLLVTEDRSCDRDYPRKRLNVLGLLYLCVMNTEMFLKKQEKGFQKLKEARASKC